MNKGWASGDSLHPATYRECVAPIWVLDNFQATFEEGRPHFSRAAQPGFGILEVDFSHRISSLVHQLMKHDMALEVGPVSQN